MNTTLNWRGNMNFEATSDSVPISLDAKSPIGKGSAPTPKELVIMGLAGCTAMDVISLLKKYRQLPESFSVHADVEQSTGKTPAVFLNAKINFQVKGQVEPQKLLEAVQLSQTKFCGVSAMLSKAFPINYEVELNGQIIGTGQAAF